MFEVDVKNVMKKGREGKGRREGNQLMFGALMIIFYTLYKVMVRYWSCIEM